MEFVFLFLGIVLILASLSFAARFFSKKKDSKTKAGEGKTVFVNCPVCGSALLKGENLHSKIFRPMNTPHQRMTVQGCPHCYPVLEAGIVRRCPVCGKSISADGELVARLFNRPDGKKHVMITGCSVCCR